MEVAPGIHRIETPLGDRLNSLHVLLSQKNQALLIDTGLANTLEEHLVPYLKNLGLDPRQIRYVLITHADFDHMGGNASMRELAPDALFLCHALDRAEIEDINIMIDERYGEFRAEHGIDETDESKDAIRASTHTVPIDVLLTGGEVIQLDNDWPISVLHTPGHSRGHLTVYDHRSRTAIITDTALWHGLVNKDGSPAFPPTYRYVDSYLASIQRLQAMPITTLLTSHYPVYRGPAVAEFLSESRAYADRVEETLRAELIQGKRAYTMRELIDVLGPRLGAWNDATSLVYPLYGHLERLMQHHLVTQNRRDGLATFRWTGPATA